MERYAQNSYRWGELEGNQTWKRICAWRKFSIKKLCWPYCISIFQICMTMEVLIFWNIFWCVSEHSSKHSLGNVEPSNNLKTLISLLMADSSSGEKWNEIEGWLNFLIQWCFTLEDIYRASTVHWTLFWALRTQRWPRQRPCTQEAGSLWGDSDRSIGRYYTESLGEGDTWWPARSLCLSRHGLDTFSSWEWTWRRRKTGAGPEWGDSWRDQEGQGKASIWSEDLPGLTAITWSCNLGPGPSFNVPELLSPLQSGDIHNPHLTGSP